MLESAHIRPSLPKLQYFKLKKACMVAIYKITSPSGKVYIGQSRAVEKRWKAYRRLSGAQFQPVLIRSFEKYRVEAHEFLIIHILPTDILQEDLDRYEQFYMDAYRAAHIQLMNVKGAGSKGLLSDETKRKISISGKGRVVSEETRRKISDRQKGKKRNLSPETVEKLASIMRGKPGLRKGVKLTPDQIERIRQSKTGKKQSPESNLKRSLKLKGKANPNMRRTFSEDTRLKLRIAQQARRERE